MTTGQQKAMELHDKGYNCAQAVACAYCAQMGLDEEAIYRTTEGFGLGMGMMEICGAISGAAVLAGNRMSAGTDKPGTTKAATYKLIRTMGNAFQAQNGSMICRELKGVDTGTALRACNDCICDACALVEQYVLPTAGATNARCCD